MKRRSFFSLAALGGMGIVPTARSERAEGGTIREEARDIPVIEECDICVLGGSCTGVFAAIRAARLA